jgi:nitrite reductase/ring-hydroxylating ferredoxin subunit
MLTAAGRPDTAVAAPFGAGDLPPEFETVRQRVTTGLDLLDELPDDATREAMFGLLEAIDTLHRDALGRMLAVVQGMAGSSALEGLTREPVVRSLLELYDLLPPEGEGQDAVVQMATTPPVADPLPELHLAAPGQPELAGLAQPERTVEAAAGDRRPLRRPRWVTVARIEELREGQLRTVRPEGTALLLLRLSGEFYAYADGCPPESMLTLQLSVVEGVEIVCPWHGCRYDGRTGRRTDGEGRLAVFPVAVQGGEVRIALGTQEVLAG